MNQKNNKEGKIIAVVGAPRSGKSFLAKKLADHFKVNVFMEGEESDFPDRIKEDIQKNIRPLERILWFRNMLVQNFAKALEEKEKGKIVIADVFWMSVMAFIPVLTKGFERELCEETLRIDQETLPLPDLVIFLRNNVETTRKFIKAGGREFDNAEGYMDEQVIENQRVHDELFNEGSFKGKLLTINREKLDFDKEGDLGNLLSQIKVLIN
jgi:deoxyadenosine/deoxycytidine kinase